MKTHVQQQIKVLEVGFNDSVSNTDLQGFDELHVIHGSQRSIYSIRNTASDLVDKSLVEIRTTEESNASFDKLSQSK